MLVGFFGDWHGNTNYARRILHFCDANKRAVKPDIYIHVGDFGIWDYTKTPKFIRVIEKELAYQEREMWVVLGNHENYHLTEKYPYDDRGLQKVSDHIYIIPRGYAWEWDKVKFGALGGAYSIDRKWRKLNKSFWLEEEITQEDFDKTITNGPYDILVTHDTAFLPKGNPPYILAKEDDLGSELCRKYIKDVLIHHKVKLNIHGHHHYRYNDIILFGNTKVVGLGCDGDHYHNNYYCLDLDDFKLEHEIY